MWQLGGNYCFCNQGSELGQTLSSDLCQRGSGGVIELSMEGPEDVGGEGNLGNNHSHFLILKCFCFLFCDV